MGAPRDEARFKPAVVAPGFVVADDFEAGNKPRKLAIVEQEGRAGLRVALEVGAGGVRDDEQAAGREERGIALEERAVEVIGLEDQVPWSLRRRFALEIERDDFEAILRADRLGEGEGEADGRDVGEGYVEPATGEHEGVAACAAADIERAAAAREEGVELGEEGG